MVITLAKRKHVSMKNIRDFVNGKCKDKGKFISIGNHINECESCACKYEKAFNECIGASKKSVTKSNGKNIHANRKNCVTMDTLYSYIHGELPDEKEVEKIKKKIDRCNECKERCDVAIGEWKPVRINRDMLII